MSKYTGGEVASYFPVYTEMSSSIVTALKSLGIQSKFSYRSEIAKANDIKSYIGTASQNIKMLNLLKQGKLIMPYLWTKLKGRD